MDKKKVIEYFGSALALAAELGINHSTISRWKSVPPWHQKTIEGLSGGQLQADPLPPPVKKESLVTKACFYIPMDTLRAFKQHCKNHDLVMSRKVAELLEKESIEL